MGILTGLLPCGLVYAFLFQAAGTAHGFQGALVMIAFGLGTIPAMVTTGLAGVWLAGRWRIQAYRFAGALMIALAAVTILRATPYACEIFGHTVPTGGTPCCESRR
jgi:hypothetical protein